MRFIDNPLGTIDGRVGAYVSDLGAGPLLIVVAVVLALLSRDRRFRVAGAAVAASAFAWAAAPVTGAPPGDAAFFTTTGDRYRSQRCSYQRALLALMAGWRGGVARVAGGLR